MAEKMDLKTFYESTKPTSQNIDGLFYDIYRNDVTSTKQGFIAASNQAFGMLAHLKAYTFDLEETNRIKRFFSLDEYTHFRGILARLQIAKSVTGQLNLVINPSVVPMIQRYIKMFEAYEQQNGIVNPYVKE